MRRSSRKDSDALRNLTFACGRRGETRSKSTNILRSQPNKKKKQAAMLDWELV